MDHTQREQLRNLAQGLYEIIAQADVSTGVKLQAVLVVRYYLVNPLLKQDPTFFEGLAFYDHTRKPGELDCCSTQWVPLMSHLLLTGYTFLSHELERLQEVQTFDVEGTVTLQPKQLMTSFTEALVRLHCLQDFNYTILRSALIDAVLNPEEITHASGSNTPTADAPAADHLSVGPVADPATADDGACNGSTADPEVPTVPEHAVP